MRYPSLALAMLALPLLAPAYSQDAKSSPEPMVTQAGSDSEGALKNTIKIQVPGIGDYLKQKSITNPNFVLYLAGTPFQGLAVSKPTEGNDYITFYLDRVETNKQQWTALLRRPVSVRTVSLTIGLDPGVTFRSDIGSFELKVFNPAIFWAAAGLFIILVGLFIWLARRSDVLREMGPPPPAVAGRVPRRAYSLARVQMAVWFFAVFVSFFLIWMITFGLDTIGPSVLALIGISTGTGLAAAVIDSNKSASMRAQKDRLIAEDSGLVATLAALTARPLPLIAADIVAQTAANARRVDIAQEVSDLDLQINTPAHVNFLTDILSDANGVSFHRFQMACWTALLVVIFLVSVWSDLAMPDFNATLLGLMGISSGTYLGFKFPEMKN